MRSDNHDESKLERAIDLKTVGPVSLLFKLNLAQRALMKEADRQLKTVVSASATQIAALIYIYHNQGCQLVDLSNELFQNKSAITTLVERMVKANLIQKEPDIMDKRAFRLHVTEKGKDALKQALPLLNEYDTDICSGFTPSEIKIIDLFLSKIVADYGPANTFFNELPAI